MAPPSRGKKSKERERESEFSFFEEEKRFIINRLNKIEENN